MVLVNSILQLLLLAFLLPETGYAQVSPTKACDRVQTCLKSLSFEIDKGKLECREAGTLGIVSMELPSSPPLMQF